MSDVPLAGMTRAALDKAETRDMATAKGALRPRDAATLILLDRRGGETLVLMGRRHARHAFMPGKFVFPGGRTDPADSRVSVMDELHPAEERRVSGTGTRGTAARARAIALSAIRETYEEAGLLIGRPAPFACGLAGWQEFARRGVMPTLGGLRFVARAITPPGRVRRFDTRFLAAWMSDVAVALPDGGPTDELEELAWLTLGEAQKLDLPSITASILDDLRHRLEEDPTLTPGAPAPFYRMRHNRYRRDLV